MWRFKETAFTVKGIRWNLDLDYRPWRWTLTSQNGSKPLAGEGVAALMKERPNLQGIYKQGEATLNGLASWKINQLAKELMDFLKQLSVDKPRRTWLIIPAGRWQRLRLLEQGPGVALAIDFMPCTKDEPRQWGCPSLAVVTYQTCTLVSWNEGPQDWSNLLERFSSTSCCINRSIFPKMNAIKAIWQKE